VRPGILYLSAGRSAKSDPEGEGAVSADDNGIGRAILLVARLAAVPVLALLLGGVAVALVLDSGSGNLPSPSGHGSGSRSPSTPAQKVAVPSSRTVTRAHHGPPAPTSTAAPAPVTTPAPGGSVRLGGHAATSPVSRQVPQAPTGGNQPATQPGGAPVPGTPPTTTQPPATRPSAGVPPPGSQEDQENQAASPASPPGLVLGHRNHVPPGQARKGQAARPRGRAVGHRNHPPGLALGHRRHLPGVPVGPPDHVPPGHARRGSRGDDGSEQDHGSHGHSAEAHGHSHGRGRGH